MGRFDRYFLSRLLTLFGFFALILVALYWVNQAVRLFDQLIGDGHSARIFLTFTALALPKLVALVIPIAGFIAALYVTNRLMGDSELVVVQATGFSPWRLARGPLAFGLLCAFGALALHTLALPAAEARLTAQRSALAEDVTAQLLRAGSFIEAADGVTFYIREITPEGELKDIFMSDTRATDHSVTYTARSAALVRREDGPRLVMFSGTAQRLRHEDQSLSVTRFDDFAVDIGALFAGPGTRPLPAEARPTQALLTAGPALAEETGRTVARLRAEGHERIAQPLLALVAPLIGFATLLTGGFSRFGTARQMLLAVVLVVLVKGLDNALIARAQEDATLWPLNYGAPLAGLAAAAVLLAQAGRKRRLPRMGARPA